jgi:hypothetical protein
VRGLWAVGVLHDRAAAFARLEGERERESGTRWAGMSGGKSGSREEAVAVRRMARAEFSLAAKLLNK